MVREFLLHLWKQLLMQFLSVRHLRVVHQFIPAGLEQHREEEQGLLVGPVGKAAV